MTKGRTVKRMFTHNSTHKLKFELNGVLWNRKFSNSYSIWMSRRNSERYNK